MEENLYFTSSEREMIYQFASPSDVPNKKDTIEFMREAASHSRIRGTSIARTMLDSVEKLEKIPEPECSMIIARVKEQGIEERDRSIRRRLAESQRQKADVKGHELTGEERYLPDAKHMITLEVRRDCAVGKCGDRCRFFLSDEGYQNARRSEQNREIRILSHAKVRDGEIIPDKKPRQMEL